MKINTVGPLEMQEYLFATTAADFAANVALEKSNVVDKDKIRDFYRESLRFHRFAMINWLMMNGVKIPVALIGDETHPEVGFQYPDHAVPG